MAGSLMVINPRRRRRRAKKARSHKLARRRRRHTLSANPRRRRVSRRRVHARRRTHSNPRFGMGGLTSGMKTGLGIGVGVVATEIGTGAAIKFIPGMPAMLTGGLGKSALKIGVGAIALPFILKKVGQHSLAKNVAIGAWVAVAVDLLHEYVTPALGLSEYSSDLSLYSSAGDLSDYPNESEVGSAENMYGDTMYGY
jgi:hypothetical protein